MISNTTYIVYSFQNTQNRYCSDLQFASVVNFTYCKTFVWNFHSQLVPHFTRMAGIINCFFFCTWNSMIVIMSKVAYRQGFRSISEKFFSVLSIISIFVLLYVFDLLWICLQVQMWILCCLEFELLFIWIFVFPYLTLVFLIAFVYCVLIVFFCQCLAPKKSGRKS